MKNQQDKIKTHNKKIKQRKYRLIKILKKLGKI